MALKMKVCCQCHRKVRIGKSKNRCKSCRRRNAAKSGDVTWKHLTTEVHNAMGEL